MATAKFTGAAIDMYDENYGLVSMRSDVKILNDFQMVNISMDRAGPKQMSVTLYGNASTSIKTEIWKESQQGMTLLLSKIELSIEPSGSVSSFSGSFRMSAQNFGGTVNKYSYGSKITGIKYVDITNISEKLNASNMDPALMSIGSLFRGNDSISGSEFSDSLRGLSGNDSIKGGAGDDFIEGGAGTDTLYGGTGADKFVFAEMKIGANWDKIMDFKLTEGDGLFLEADIYTNHRFVEVKILRDKMDLSGKPLDHQNLIFEKTTSKLYYDADGIGTGKAAELVTQLVGVQHLTEDQLHFI